MELTGLGTLKIEDGYAEIEPIEDVDAVGLVDTCRRLFPKDAYIFAWQIYTAGWGRWDGNEWHLLNSNKLSTDFLRELRLFDRQAELHVVRVGNKFCGRYISDCNSGTKSMYVDTFGRLLGKSEGAKCGEHMTVLRDESRQLEQCVPIVIDKDKYCGLITRSYINEVGNEGQLSYTDYRFVDLDEAE